jgi:hypothetical protein
VKKAKGAASAAPLSSRLQRLAGSRPARRAGPSFAPLPIWLGQKSIQLTFPMVNTSCDHELHPALQHQAIFQVGTPRDFKTFQGKGLANGGMAGQQKRN